MNNPAPIQDTLELNGKLRITSPRWVLFFKNLVQNQTTLSGIPSVPLTDGLHVLNVSGGVATWSSPPYDGLWVLKTTGGVTTWEPLSIS